MAHIRSLLSISLVVLISGISVCFAGPGGGDVLFIVNTGTGEPEGDNALATLLQGAGHLVTVLNADDSTPEDANGRDLIVISSTVSSTAVGTKFTDSAVPVMLWEQSLFDDLGMSPGGSFTVDSDAFDILDSSHPMAAGKSGTVTISSVIDTIRYGDRPNTGPDVIEVATIAGNSDQLAIWGYDTGGMMMTGTAPARRIGFALGNSVASANLTQDGEDLFLAAVDWAMGVDGGNGGGGILVSQVLKGTAVSDADGTVTVNLPSSVDPSKSVLFHQVRTHGNAPNPPTRPGNSMLAGHLASGSTIEFYRISEQEFDSHGVNETMNISWCVVEFLEGVSVQRGTMSVEVSPADIGITPVASLDQAFVLHSWSAVVGNQGNNFSTNDVYVAELTSTSNLQLRGPNPTNYLNAWQVVEFTNPAAALVQKGMTALGDGELTGDVTLGTAVDPDASFVLLGYAGTIPDAVTGRPAEYMIRAELVDGSTVRLTREASSSGSLIEANDLVWQVVELRDGSRVLHGAETVAQGTATASIALGTTVDTDRAVAFASTQMGMGQCAGSTAYLDPGDGSDSSIYDAPGVTSFTMDLGTTTLEAQRNNTESSATFNWFVVEFAETGTIPNVVNEWTLYE